MRLWTVHPRYLDRQGIVALWREGLLAQAVLLGRTKGYTHHPQLDRFRAQRSPVAAIATYLEFVFKESGQRGYSFDFDRIQKRRMHKLIPETRGQLLYEWSRLLAKMKTRSPMHFASLRHISDPQCHPLFEIVPGGIRQWERVPRNKGRHPATDSSEAAAVNGR